MSTVLRLVGDALRGDHKKLREMLATRVKRLSVKPFMDMNTMLEERLLQCCVHVGLRSERQHQCAPFCAVQAWSPLGVMKPAERSAIRPLRQEIMP